MDRHECVRLQHLPLFACRACSFWGDLAATIAHVVAHQFTVIE